MILPELPPEHRSGYVAVVGKPNVGKSTLINAYVGHKVAITSPRPQTTRDVILGILTRPDAQVVFLDTPGIHGPRHKLGEVMVARAEQTLPEADLAVFLVDVSRPPDEEDRRVAERLKESAVETVLAMNKSDLLKPEHVLAHTEAYRGLAPEAGWMHLSATRGDNREELLQMILDALPQGPRYFPEDQLSDKDDRFITAELIREKALFHLRQEVPHAVAVQVEEFQERQERQDDLIRISANIYVEKESQKGILIGKGGQQLKRIGSEARRELEMIFGRKVFLELWVKVWPKWRKHEARLRELGYTGYRSTSSTSTRRHSS